MGDIESLSASGSLSVTASTVGTSYGTPATPTGLQAVGAIQTIVVSWDAPVYPGHAYAEVWRSQTDLVGEAVKVGMTPGQVYTDTVGPDFSAYYWVKFVNVDGTSGAFNALSGTAGSTGSDLSYTFDLLTEAYGTGSVAPYFQLDAPTTINGVEIPAGTYMKAAFIYDASITNAKIANLAVDDAKISSIAATKLTAGAIGVGEYIQSSDYIAGAQGWKIHGDGTAEMSNATVRGTVYATDGEFTGTVKAGTTILGGSAGDYSTGTGFFGGVVGSTYQWRVGNPSGARIQWNGSAVEIYTPDNALALTSGGITWDDVSGKPTFGDLAIKDSVDYTTDVTNTPTLGDLAAKDSVDWDTEIVNIPGFGDFAFLDQITDANVATYIGSAAIGEAYIADLAVTEAKIKDLAVSTGKIKDAAVDTLQIAGQAVTIPEAAYTSGSITIVTTETEIQSVGITNTGAPALIGFGCKINRFGRQPSGDDYVYASVTINVYMDGTPIFSTVLNSDRRYDPPDTTYYFSIKYTPTAGSHTFYLKATPDRGQNLSDGTTLIVDRVLSILEVKR